ncbi:MAG: zinc ribbon domain-containing protein [Chloroflexi bacterium]|nr:zinc ribbon domain-containing protein [Chloroflexota bacterium]
MKKKIGQFFAVLFVILFIGAPILGAIKGSMPAIAFLTVVTMVVIIWTIIFCIKNRKKGWRWMLGKEDPTFKRDVARSIVKEPRNRSGVEGEVLETRQSSKSGARNCSKCGARPKTGDRFCRSCGARLG